MAEFPKPIRNPQIKYTKVSARLIYFCKMLVLQRKPFAFELFFCLANAGFYTFSSKTRSIVQRPNNQLNQ